MRKNIFGASPEFWGQGRSRTVLFNTWVGRYWLNGYRMYPQFDSSSHTTLGTVSPIIKVCLNDATNYKIFFSQCLNLLVTGPISKSSFCLGILGTVLWKVDTRKTSLPSHDCIESAFRLLDVCLSRCRQTNIFTRKNLTESLAMTHLVKDSLER